ncbi:hypothetical protein GCM10010347_38100 [Streptomyces cirratus]|uniref:Uncharacterized protein n=1 Tax=Streptomyces cirratus TaxID=68187 RepID=A0ABQ3EUW0_9ACTN|nr:hypothetical protein GCM10010347_38100 [Streptomyces cirratus]
MSAAVSPDIPAPTTATRAGCDGRLGGGRGLGGGRAGRGGEDGPETEGGGTAEQFTPAESADVVDGQAEAAGRGVFGGEPAERVHLRRTGHGGGSLWVDGSAGQRRMVAATDGAGSSARSAASSSTTRPMIS